MLASRIDKNGLTSAKFGKVPSVFDEVQEAYVLVINSGQLDWGVYTVQRRADSYVGLQGPDAAVLGGLLRRMSDALEFLCLINTFSLALVM